MGRRVTRFLFIIPAAAVVLLSLLLATCSNEFDIFNAIKTEMKIANDLFLEVKSISPEENATLVNPGVPIVVVFDRSIDPETANESTIFITPVPDPAGPLKELDFGDYDDDTKTLTIEPIDFMDGPESYTIRITKGVKGADGSELQDEIIWSFETREWPAGSIEINGGADYIADDSDVTLNISYNTQVQWMKYSTVEADLDPAGNWVGASTSVSNFALAPDDGERSVYIKFADGSYNESEVESYSIFRDTAPPEPQAGADRNILITTSPPPPSAVSHTGTSSDPVPSSGIKSRVWTLESGPGSLDIGPIEVTDDTVSTTILADTDSDSVPYVLRLTETDNAGNSSYDEVLIYWDRTAPDPPTFTGGTASPATILDPTWEWQTGGSPDSQLYYRYSLDGSIINKGTPDTSYTPSSDLDYGPHTLSVAEKDKLGNWSTDNSRTIYVSPSDISPLWGATGVSTKLTLSWPSSGFSRYTYKVYFGLPGDLSLIYSGSDLSVTVPYTLSYLTTYEWYYTATLLVMKPKRYPAGTENYSFRTRFYIKLP